MSAQSCCGLPVGRISAAFLKQERAFPGAPNTVRDQGSVSGAFSDIGDEDLATGPALWMCLRTVQALAEDRTVHDPHPPQELGLARRPPF